jgi:dephospho-CoA kinase
MSEPLVIVISGQVSAGKTTAAKMLRDNCGYQYARISQAIRTRWDPTQGEKPPRSWYQKMGMELHRTIGQRALCRETMAFIPTPLESFVIDGARWKEDTAYFSENFGARSVHLHLTASSEVRKKRFEDREKDVSFEDADRHEVEHEVSSLAAEADAVFDNSADDLSRLEAFLNQVLESHARAR